MFRDDSSSVAGAVFAVSAGIESLLDITSNIIHVIWFIPCFSVLSSF